MPAKGKGKWIRTPNVNAIRLHYDDRKGLGYGVLEPTGFNAPRQRQGNFPYLDPDPYANEEGLSDMPEDELDAFITKVNQGYLPSDFFSGAGIDRFYFVGGNTPMQELAMRENDSHFLPPVYQGRKHGPLLRTGAAFPYSGGGGTNYKRTGSVSGYSQPPPALAIDADLGQFAVNNLEDIPDSTERTLDKLRVIIADILKQQIEAA